MCQHGFLQNRCSTANKMYNLYTNLSCAAKLWCMYRLSEHLDQIPHINLKLLCHGCKHYLWSHVAHVEQYKNMHTHAHTYTYIYIPMRMFQLSTNGYEYWSNVWETSIHRKCTMAFLYYTMYLPCI
jgi:hypothetical protein